MCVFFLISSYLNVVKIYVERCEGLREGFVPPRQPAQSLCSVRLRGVIWLRAAAHWAAQLPGLHHGQTTHLRHTHPITPHSRSERRSVYTNVIDTSHSNTQIIFHQIQKGCQGLPVMPADLQTFNSHSKDCGSSWDDPARYRLFLEFSLASL